MILKQPAMLIFRALIACGVIVIHYTSCTSIWYYGLLLAMVWMVCSSRFFRSKIKLLLDDPTNNDELTWNEFEKMTAMSTILAVMLISFAGLQNHEESQCRGGLKNKTAFWTPQEAVQLPQSLNELYYRMKSQNFLAYITNPDKWTPEMQKLIKYTSPAVFFGRPLNKVMVIMMGQTGSGKSTTINHLFADNVCATSSETSGTHKVTEYGKELDVTSESPAIKAVLSFVDLPGALDVDHTKEAQNLASVKKFREESADLATRGGFQLPKTLVDIEISEKVYPNLILMMVKASDNRMVGPDSNLQKSLKVLDECQLLDKHHVNLIIVVTHAMSIPHKKYKEQSYRIIENIRGAVYEVLDIRDVQVVFVENMAEDYDMVKIDGSDFYSLPDGEASHYNLIQAMVVQFKDNHDLLGRLLCGWYFAETCPEKQNKPKILNSVSHSTLSPDEIKEAQEALVSIGIQAASHQEEFPILQFHVLGRGYCPRGESLRHVSVFWEAETKQMKIYGRKYTVPKHVHIFETNETHFEHLSWDTRETYANYKKKSYGLDNDILLVVNADSRGRWVEDNNMAHSKASLVSFLHETRLINVRMDDMEKQVREDLIDVIEELPDWYDPMDTREFHAFFSKWGTHFVCEVWLGGAVKIDTSIHQSHFSEKVGSEISHRLKTIFSLLAENREIDKGSFASADVYMHDEILTITGGNPPQVTTLKDLTPQKFSDWAESIKRSPTEMKYSVKLYPYYNLVKGRHRDSLRDATLEYLAGSMQPESKLKRENVAKQIVREVTQEQRTGPSCFPEIVRVYTATGKTFISNLNSGEKIQTIQYNTQNNEEVALTEFYTYLHSNPDVWTEFLIIALENGGEIAISANHLIFTYVDGNVEAIPASQILIGNILLFKKLDDTNFDLVKVVKLSKKILKGVYAPLTHEGTMIVNGVLVSCYASINSHVIAHFGMAPLRLWHNAHNAFNSLCNKWLSFRSMARLYVGLSLDECKYWPDESVHVYARWLMVLRNVVFC